MDQPWIYGCQHISFSSSTNALPDVSTGNASVARAANNGTRTNSITARLIWHVCTRLTATNGQMMPPKREKELAIPRPDERMDVGYTWRGQGLI